MLYFSFELLGKNVRSRTYFIVSDGNQFVFYLYLKTSENVYRRLELIKDELAKFKVSHNNLFRA